MIKMNRIVCPYLHPVSETCTIYDKRFSCCRNYPQKEEGMFCNDSKCVYDANGNLDCGSCKDKCCKHLAMDVFKIELMDMSCQECKSVYCDKKVRG